LRVLPKVIYDWSELPAVEVDSLTSQSPDIKDLRWRALVEALVAYYYHTELWKSPPEWCKNTILERTFVPRAAVTKIGAKHLQKIFFGTPVEFREKIYCFRVMK
jgi:hypothetical protein